ncbi:PqqD family peptide modification chaperone [Indioceanicola profundi]|uniref:PqqD family peptide modification chaperone n=1 Tax=Indioceanicola profundi TaxID=2220096 RepID=UPI000E6AA19C|nr:PqqD family peptide modification chaperone [Indioceanicola profundi]
MTEFFSFVSKAEKIRCRPEEAGNHLLYNPRTDLLHIVDLRGKQIFDLCDGRAIDDVVREGCALFEGTASTVAAQQVLDFLCALKRRDLVVMR